MKRVKVAIVTTSRADYGLLYPLIKKVKFDDYFELKLIATGSHLSSYYGNTISNIEQDGLKADYVKMTSSGNLENDLCNSISKGLIDFSTLFTAEKPDLVIVLGDRYELWSVCIASVINKIPIAHIHGGEATFGLIDESIRHSVTKMSSLHFPSIEQYGKRIIQMGENPDRVFVVGALGIDNIMNMDLFSCDELSKITGINFGKKVALMTYHPVTLDECDAAKKQAKNVLDALVGTEMPVLITMPNSDTGSNFIYDEIIEYTKNYPDKIYLVKNLGQKAYLSAMKYSKVMVGNSSSGVIESASFKLPVVNIGDRQAGRFKPWNVIDCECSVQAIADSINLAVSNQFENSISELVNPYGDGYTSDRIIKIIKSIDFNGKSKLIKKGFYDIDYYIQKNSQGC